MIKKNSIEIVISKSDDSVFDGEKLAEVLSKYRWVENSFNTCHFDSETNEVFFQFSELASDPTLFPNLLDCYHIEEDGSTWKRGVTEIYGYDDSDIVDTETYEVEFGQIVEEIAACIFSGSIELSLTRSDCNCVNSELIHIDSKARGYRKSMRIDGSVNSVYFYEEV